jgi:hypothetical protein
VKAEKERVESLNARLQADATALGSVNAQLTEAKGAAERELASALGRLEALKIGEVRNGRRKPANAIPLAWPPEHVVGILKSFHLCQRAKNSRLRMSSEIIKKTCE